MRYFLLKNNKVVNETTIITSIEVINNEYINARIFVSINMYQGLSINFDFTPKNFA